LEDNTELVMLSEDNELGWAMAKISHMLRQYVEIFWQK